MTQFENNTLPDGHVQRSRAFSSWAISSDSEESLESLHLTGAATADEIQSQFQHLQNEFTKLHSEKANVLALHQEGEKKMAKGFGIL